MWTSWARVGRRVGRGGAAPCLVCVLTAAAGAATPVVHSDADPCWYMPAGSDEAVYVGSGPGGAAEGDEGSSVHPADPWIDLDKEPIGRGPVNVEVVTDAKACRIASGAEGLVIPIEPGAQNRITLDGDAMRPRLALHDRELAELRGAWVRVFHRDQAATLRVTFQGATYVNLRFSGPGLAAPTLLGRDDAAPRGGGGAAGRGAGIALADMDDSGVFRVDRDPPRATADPVRLRQALPGDQPVGRLDGPATHWSLSLDVGMDYTTQYFYRGIGQENQDPIVQPWTEVRLNVLDAGAGRGDLDRPGLLRNVDLFVGLMSSHHWGPSGRDGVGEAWAEFDFHGGVRLRLLDRWELEVGYLNRSDPQTSGGDVHQYEFKLTYDDHDPKYTFQLWPYALVSVEFDGQSDGGIGLPKDPRFNEGVYLELGIEPRFVVHTLPSGAEATLTVPAKIGLSLDDYFEDGAGDDQTFGFADLGVDLRWPLLRARGEAERWFDWCLKTGVHLLFLGDSLQMLSELNGTGGHDVEVIGTLGIEMSY